MNGLLPRPLRHMPGRCARGPRLARRRQQCAACRVCHVNGIRHMRIGRALVCWRALALRKAVLVFADE